jgi:ribosome recycling factor
LVRIAFPSPSARRPFSSQATLQGKFDDINQSKKKRKGSDRDPKTPDAWTYEGESRRGDYGKATRSGGATAAREPVNPLDLTDVTTKLAELEAHYRDAIKKLRTGGRFNPDVIGDVKVHYRSTKQEFRLRELAAIVPGQGRKISLLCHEEESIKPIVSAIQSHPDFNQQPQRSDDNPLELTLYIEPETKEQKTEKLKAACLKWRERIRGLRHQRDRTVGKWLDEGLVLKDQRKKADESVGKAQAKAFKVIDDLEKEAAAAFAREAVQGKG